MAPFRILSLDGGGLLGAFSASVLATYEAECKQVHGKSLVEHFDLIVGTSTGGILAIGLAMGVPAADLVGFYRDKGKDIFPKTAGVRGWVKPIFNLFTPSYRPEALRAELERVLQSNTMGDAMTGLVIPTYDATAGEIYLFKTPHHRDCSQHADVAAVDVALATSAAPTYFPAHEVPGRGIYIDGGIWGNCPADLGIVEAISFFGKPIEDIHLLSISTTSNPFRISKTQQLGGLFGWGMKIIDTFMFSQVQASVGKATCLLRDRRESRPPGAPADRFHRIDYIAEPRLYSMDDTAMVEELINLGKTRAEQKLHREVVETWFLNGSSAGLRRW